MHDIKNDKILKIHRYTHNKNTNSLVFAGCTSIFSLSHILGMHHEYASDAELYQQAMKNGEIHQISRYREDLGCWTILWNVSKEELEKEFFEGKYK